MDILKETQAGEESIEGERGSGGLEKRRKKRGQPQLVDGASGRAISGVSLQRTGVPERDGGILR